MRFMPNDTDSARLDQKFRNPAKKDDVSTTKLRPPQRTASAISIG